MANSNAPRFLDSGGTEYALSVEQFTGLVIEAFRAKTIFWDNSGSLTAFKTITAGRSHQFILVGDDPTPEYHTPGVELLGQTFEFDEGAITVDDLLVSHFDVPIDQVKLAHWDVMKTLSNKHGRSLAVDYDKKLAQITTLAARAAAKTGFHNGGNRVQAATAGDMGTAYPASSTGADNFRKDVAKLARLMDEDNVPEMNRTLIIAPYIREVLANVTSSVIFDKDLSAETNDLNKRSLGLLEGFRVMVSNQLPSTNITTGPTKYQGDFRFDGATGRPVALALAGADEGEAAVGVVQAGPIMAGSWDDHRRNTTFSKSQMMIGADKLAVYSAGEIFAKS